MLLPTRRQACATSRVTWCHANHRRSQWLQRYLNR